MISNDSTWATWFNISHNMIKHITCSFITIQHDSRGATWFTISHVLYDSTWFNLSCVFQSFNINITCSSIIQNNSAWFNISIIQRNSTWFDISHNMIYHITCSSIMIQHITCSWWFSIIQPIMCSCSSIIQYKYHMFFNH